MKQITAFIMIGLVAALCGAQTPPNYGVFRQEGIASWYGNEFDGRLTASGEVFRAALFTAAHPSLPFGTQLLVTNTHNNKQVVVRVNDRGPFVAARIIDLSKAAAEKLDMVITGTAPVIVEVTNMPAGYFGEGPGPVLSTLPAPAPAPVYIPPPAPVPVYTPPPAPAPVVQQVPLPPPPPPPPAPVPVVPSYRPVEMSKTAAEIKPAIPLPGSGKLYRLQVGSYRIARYAVEAFDKLRDAGLNPSYEKNGDMYRVVLAGIRAEEVPALAERLGTAGFREALIRDEPRE